MFRDYNDMAARIDDPRCAVTADSVLVLQNAGPLGGPGMPEWGMLPIPKKLLEQGVRDMVRISDARMSGTAYGACVLHVAPESFVGGPLAFVRDGDIIELDVPARRLTLTCQRRGVGAASARRQPAPPIYPRGYGWLYSKHSRRPIRAVISIFSQRPGRFRSQRFIDRPSFSSAGRVESAAKQRLPRESRARRRGRASPGRSRRWFPSTIPSSMGRRSRRDCRPR